MTSPVAVPVGSVNRSPNLWMDMGVVTGSGLGQMVRPGGPGLPVVEALEPLLPEGLRRGSTVSVEGSVSLLLALVSAASADGAWCVLVDLPPISAEAARDHGVDLARLALVPATGSDWVAVVGALLDAFDILVARPPGRLTDTELRRLAARTRQRGTVLVPFLTGGVRWPLADLRLMVEPGPWSGIGDGYGRLRRRQVTATATGRGQAFRPRSSELWLPNPKGEAELCLGEPVAPVLDIHRARAMTGASA